MPHKLVSIFTRRRPVGSLASRGSGGHESNMKRWGNRASRSVAVKIYGGAADSLWPHDVGGERKFPSMVVGWSRATILCDMACVWSPKLQHKSQIFRACCKI
jgi:hypothetical protein